MYLNKFILVIWAIFSLNLQPMDFKNNMASKILKSTEYLEVFSTKIAPVLACIYLFTSLVQEYKKINNSADLNPRIKNWCKDILLKYKFDDIEQINFKNGVNDANWSTHLNTICLDFLSQFQLAIRKNLEFHEFSLIHEIKHLKNQDVLKRIISIPTCLFITYYLINKLDKFFLKQFNLNIDLNWQQKILKSIFIFLKLHFLLVISNTLITQYLRYQENTADDFAIKLLNDPRKIEIIAAYFHSLNKNEIKQIAPISEIPLTTSIYIGNLNYLQINNFRLAIKIIKFIYSISNKQNQTFAEWLNSHPNWFKVLHWLLDPAHSTSYDRAIKLEKRRLELITNVS